MLLSWLWHFLQRQLAAPTFPDKEQTQAARWLNFLLLTLLVLILGDSIAILLGLLDQDTAGRSILLTNAIALAANLGAWLLMRRGYIKFVSFMLLTILFILITYLNAVVFQSIRTPNVVVYFAFTPLAGLLLGRRNMNIFTALCVMAIALIFTLEWRGVLTPDPTARSIWDDGVELCVAIALNIFLLNACIRRLEEKAEEIRYTATALATANQELQLSQTQLQQARAELEQRVEQRTQELRQTNTHLHAEIKERQQAEAQLAHDALHDALTELPNRLLLMDRLRHALEFAKRHGDYRFAVLFLDVDAFKVINDSLGHTIGDQLLIVLAQKLQIGLPPSATIARLGGDEFVILLEDIQDTPGVTHVAHRIQAAFKQPFQLEGQQVFASASIGIVADTAEYDRPEDILRDADIAMYHAKALGKARFALFNITMREQAMTRLALESDLRLALAHGEFVLYYQPIVSLQSDQIIGFEALLRWHHPKRGLLGPGEFIAIAEETGLIIPIGTWLLAEACQQLQAWHIRFPRKPPLTMSVNVSSKQFATPNFVEQVEQILQTVGLEATYLHLEITEGMCLSNVEEVMTIFKRLNRVGIQFHVDDFGTGYSSLAYLQDFPIQTIKIDRAFVRRIDSSTHNTDLVYAIITMAHSLGMATVAEGVETIEQLNYLKQVGCDYGQGYLLSRPVDKAAVEQLLKAPSTTFAASAMNESAMGSSPTGSLMAVTGVSAKATGYPF